MPVNKKNKPQLSAEMEKRFEEEAKKIGSFLNNELNSTENVKDNVKNITIEWGGMMQFLTTALEEQTAEYVRRVEEQIRINGTDKEGVGWITGDEVISLLTQKKEEAK